MKYIRVAIAVLVIAASVLLAMPGLLAGDDADTGVTPGDVSAVVPVPTPDYDEIAPEVTAAPTAAPAPEAEETAAPAETAAPSGDEGPGPQYVLDLWLDASPNMIGVSPFDAEDNYRRSGDGYGKWLGGYFYTASASGSSGKITQEGWAPYLLNLLYGKEVTDIGAVRILRYNAESMLSRQTLDTLAQTYPEMDERALIRDTLTYHVIRNNSENHFSFFRNLLRTGGKMDPGAGNPYALNECFFQPNNAKYNNRTVIDKSNTGKNADSDCDWQRETTDTALLAEADLLIDAAYAAHNQTVLANAPSASAETSEQDYLYYVLSAMDPSRLNAVVIDTLGLPEIDHTDLYAQRIRDMIAENNGDLGVGFMAFQLDYAGKIATIGGRTLETGFLWGYENMYKTQNGNNTQLRWGFVQPMPKPLLMIVIGPQEQVNKYVSTLSSHLDREMQEGRELYGTRGEPQGRVDSTYEIVDTFKFLGTSYTSPVFSFQYQATVMKAMDVVAEQSALMDALSLRMRESQESLVFTSDEEVLETSTYLYDTSVGNSVSEEAVPVVTTNLLSPLVISLDLALSEEDAHSVTEDQYDSVITIRSALETQSFTLEEIDALSRTGELDLSKTSAILGDQAYIGADDRIYKYHLTDGSGLMLSASQPVIEGGRLSLTLSTDEVPAPGYYWITLEMRSKALAELDNRNWNAMGVWMQADTKADGFDPATGPAVLDPENYSWEFTPETYDLNNYKTTDSKLTATSNIFVKASKSDYLHHAWGASGTPRSSIFPADIPPVFRLFQLNRIASSIRDGLLDRTGSIDSSAFLTRHFIICVPEPTTAGEP